MKITIENKHVLGLASWLNELNLSGSKSRIRTRFVKVLAERFKENEEFRTELINKYGKKEKGELVKTADGNSVVLKDREKFAEELTDLLNEKFTSTLDGNDAVILKSIVLDTDYTFGPKEEMAIQEKEAKIRQANDYETWCKSFEEMKK